MHVTEEEKQERLARAAEMRKLKKWQQEAHLLTHEPSMPDRCDGCAQGKLKQKPARRVPEVTDDGLGTAAR